MPEYSKSSDLPILYGHSRGYKMAYKESRVPEKWADFIADGVPKNLIRQVISTTQQALSENDLGSREVFKGRGWRVGLAIKIRGGIFPAK